MTSHTPPAPAWATFLDVLAGGVSGEEIFRAPGRLLLAEHGLERAGNR
jgi:hypothetical protein